MKTIRGWNLAGVLLLCVLCANQWRANSRLEHERRQLQLELEQQTGRLEALTAASKQGSLDLAELKRLYAQASAESATAASALEQLRLRANQLESQLHPMRLALTNWMEAVRVRDLQIRTANQQLAALTNSPRP